MSIGHSGKVPIRGIGGKYCNFLDYCEEALTKHQLREIR